MIGTEQQGMLDKCMGYAQSYLEDSPKLQALVGGVESKLELMAKAPGVSGAVAQARTGVRMLKAYLSGSYTKVPVKSLIAAIGAFIYFNKGDDLIPDDTPWIGYADDAALILFALKSLSDDLEAFEAWEAAQGQAGAG